MSGALQTDKSRFRNVMFEKATMLPLLVSDHIFMKSTLKRGEESWNLSRVFQILLFLSNRSIVHFWLLWEWEGEGKKIGLFYGRHNSHVIKLAV